MGLRFVQCLGVSAFGRKVSVHCPEAKVFRSSQVAWMIGKTILRVP